VTRFASAFFSVLLGASVALAEQPRPCTIGEMNEIRLSSSRSNLVVVSGTVQLVKRFRHAAVPEDIPPSSSPKIDINNVIVEDASGCSTVRISSGLPVPRPGDFVELVCRKHVLWDNDKQMVVEKIRFLGQGAVSPPLAIPIEDLDEDHHDLVSVDTEGTVVEVSPDEIDERFDILLLKDGAAVLPLFIPTMPQFRDLTGARVRVTARYNRLASGFRRFSGPFLLAERPDDLQIVTPPPSDPTDVPELDPGDFRTPREIARMDIRSMSGRVLAAWEDGRLMLRVGGVVVNVRLMRGVPLPPCGAWIKVAGSPEVDLYRINLTRARWKSVPTAVQETDDQPLAVTAGMLLRGGNDTPQSDCRYHGRLVRLTGRLAFLPAAEDRNRRFDLYADGCRIPVDISGCPDVLNGLAAGSTVEVTGRCFLETDVWRSDNVLPRIRETVLIVRTQADIRVVRRPDWWTPQRLLFVIIGLIVLMSGCLAWIRVLNRLVERRGRQLYRAEIERASSALRIDERTRLAVELHDSLSQSLTGVALQINAGRSDLAANTLKSCREELRNCLWDLRNNAIDAESMDEAIRQTLEPHLGAASLVIRFNVPRSMLTDNTAYAILRIIRELAVNGLRHGRATQIRIAGCREPGRLLFSVGDNGCGFDPSRHPGIAEGHFGLQGVFERVASLGGHFSICSQPDKGTKSTVTLPLPGEAPAVVRPSQQGAIFRIVG